MINLQFFSSGQFPIVFSTSVRFKHQPLDLRWFSEKKDPWKEWGKYPNNNNLLLKDSTQDAARSKAGPQLFIVGLPPAKAVETLVGSVIYCLDKLNIQQSLETTFGTMLVERKANARLTARRKTSTLLFFGHGVWKWEVQSSCFFLGCVFDSILICRNCPLSWRCWHP